MCFHGRGLFFGVCGDDRAFFFLTDFVFVLALDCSPLFGFVIQVQINK